MCEIFFLYSKNGEVDTTTLARFLHTAVSEASTGNSDGFGLFNEDKKVYKSDQKMGYEHVGELLDKYKGSKFVVLHLRFATRGQVVVENSHPFKHQTNVLVHNGTVNTPKKYQKGRADSYQLLRDIYKRKDRDTIEAIKDSMNRSTGSVSVFFHDYKDDLYYFRERSRFTFAEIDGTDQLIGATERSRLSSMVDAEKLQYIHPSEGDIYQVQKGKVEKVDEFDTTKYRSDDSDVVYSSRHGYRGHGFRRYPVQETDYEEYKKKQNELEELYQ